MMTIEKVIIERLDATGAEQELPALAALLRDAAEGGASVGFLLPLSDEQARAYWRGVIDALRREERILLVARVDGRIAGTVQIDPARQPNGRHRAEVVKLLVHRAARRQGIGGALMRAVEAAAREAARTLLVLDTRRGDDAERLYRSLGYIEAGIVPRFAIGTDGALHDTVFFYRELML